MKSIIAVTWLKHCVCIGYETQMKQADDLTVTSSRIIFKHCVSVTLTRRALSSVD